jgi:hypothetical protein
MSRTWSYTDAWPLLVKRLRQKNTVGAAEGW